MTSAAASQRPDEHLGSHRPKILQFQVVGTIAHAAHFVRANWPREATKPELDTTVNPMTLSFRFDGPTIRDLQRTLSRAMSIQGPLVESARSLRMMLAARLVGRTIPEVASPAHGTLAG